MPQLVATDKIAADRSRATQMKNRVRILLADDHPLVRKGIGSCLARQRNLEIVGEAADGREALARTK